ncbi:MAG: 30S ribosomal protein S5 [Rickettsiaceae bacterium]|nr:30S ribosomal protein S5 [Rickettsiaceae bacterium]
MKNNQKKNFETLSENLVDVNRVTKVVKGGRKFSFSAIMIVGDENGKVGYGHGKAKEVTDSRAKATKDSRKKLMSVPLYQNRTIHHDIIGRSGAAKVILRRAPAGTGIIAGGPMRAIFSCLGVADIVAKSLGSCNPNAMIAATFDALSKLQSPKSIATRRGKNIKELSVSGVKGEKAFRKDIKKDPKKNTDKVDSKEAKKDTKKDSKESAKKEQGQQGKKS